MSRSNYTSVSIFLLFLGVALSCTDRGADNGLSGSVSIVEYSVRPNEPMGSKSLTSEIPTPRDGKIKCSHSAECKVAFYCSGYDDKCHPCAKEWTIDPNGGCCPAEFFKPGVGCFQQGPGTGRPKKK